MMDQNIESTESPVDRLPMDDVSMRERLTTANIANGANDKRTSPRVSEFVSFAVLHHNVRSVCEAADILIPSDSPVDQSRV